MFSIENKFEEEYKNYVHEEFFGKSIETKFGNKDVKH